MPPGDGAARRADGADDRESGRGGARLVWLTAALALVPFVAQAVRVGLDPGTVVLTGDHALIDLAVRDALRLRQDLGVYSRIGLFHPGPAMFYLLAPLVALSGAAAWSTVAATAVLNGLLLSLSVVVVGTRWGPRLAASWALVATALALSVDLRLLVVPWNPLLLVPLMVLMLGVVASSDRIVACAGAVLVGSVLVQTHLATTPTVAVLVLFALVRAVRAQLARRRRGAERRPRAEIAWAALVAAGAGLVWVPPVVQQVTTEPGNLGLVVRYFGGAEDAPGSIVRSLAAVGRSLNLLSPRVTGSLDAERPAWIALVLVVLVAAAAVARLSPSPAHRHLGAVALVSTAAAALSATRITGSRFWYLTLWMGVTGLPLVVVAVDGVFALALRRRPPARPVPGHPMIVPAGLVGVVAVAAIVRVLSGPVFAPEEFPNFARLRCQVEAMDGAAGAGDEEDTVLHLDVDDGGWVAGVGLAVELESRGIDVSFDRRMAGFVPDHRIARERRGSQLFVASAEAECS